MKITTYLATATAAITGFLTSVALAGGEQSTSEYRYSASAAAIQQRIASHQAALYSMEANSDAMISEQIAARKAKVIAVPPVQDKYGDPMYTAYGPLPYGKGDPLYSGPRYAASFSRPFLAPVPDGEYRGYARGAFSNPGLTAQTDVSLGVATNSSYLQQGMQVAPGSMAPSAARAMINNP